MDAQVVVEIKFGDPFKAWVDGSSADALAWIIHEVSSQKEKDALKG